MKYKDLLVGDWFKYKGTYYIKSQKYTDPKFINVSLSYVNIISIDENAEVEFASYFFAIETVAYRGNLAFAPLGKMVQNEKCIYMRVNCLDEIDTVIIFSFYNNCGRWFSSRACPYDEVETFTRKVEYWEN